MLTFLGVWFFVSCVVAPAVGSFMAAGLGETDSGQPSATRNPDR